LPRTQQLAWQVEATEAWQHLQTMLENHHSPRQQAAIYYEQWQLDKSTSSQTQARIAYEKVVQQSPTAEAHQRALELGAINLPPPADIPPLPSLITDTPLNLDTLLERVKQNLIHLS